MDVTQSAGFAVAPSNFVLDPDDFGSDRPKTMNVIDSNTLEHGVVRKPVPAFRHHAVAKQGNQP
jgi:hypothetical protein